MKEAIILAGGFGTRLQSVVKDVPKPMAPVAGNPYLVYLVRYLKSYGVEHIVLSVGYLSEVVEDYFKAEYLGVKISYSKEDAPLGTGGGIRLALEKCEKKNVIILNGDSFFDVDINKLKKFHKKHKATVSLGVREVENVGRYGEVVLNDEKEIVKFSEKSDKAIAGLINGGVYLMKRKALNTFALNTKFSLEQDYFQKQANTSSLYAKEFNSYFIDIGIPTDFERANKDFLDFKY
tara:strand:+ start:307 stop:1011 length:705 start_codon:yes stop_codon:yes gene_type:complete